MFSCFKHSNCVLILIKCKKICFKRHYYIRLDEKFNFQLTLLLNVYYLYVRTQGQPFYSVEFCVIIVKCVVIYNNYSYYGGTS